MVHDGDLFNDSARRSTMEMTHHPDTQCLNRATDGQCPVEAQDQPSNPAVAQSRSLAALILAIPPGDASDEWDFARVQ